MRARVCVGAYAKAERAKHEQTQVNLFALSYSSLVLNHLSVASCLLCDTSVRCGWPQSIEQKALMDMMQKLMKDGGDSPDMQVRTTILFSPSPYLPDRI